MSNKHPPFTSTLGGCVIVALPFLWFFDWKPWAWIAMGVFCVLMCIVWLSEALKVYRAELGVKPESGPARSDNNDDDLSNTKVVWRGNRQIRFTYKGYDSDPTEREVTVHHVNVRGRSSSDIYFFGHCHLRNEPRTFRLDRIKGKVVDTSTGEIKDFRQMFDMPVQ